MRANLAKSLAWIDEDEGPELNIAAGEPGGSSKHGVSMTVLREYRAEHGMKPPTMDDMRAVDAELAGAIYTERFAVPIRFDDLPDGVDYRMLDIAVSAGVGGANAIYREIAPQHQDASDLIVALGQRWLKWKMDAATPEGRVKYRAGWTNRGNRAEKRALSLLTVAPAKPASDAPATPAPVAGKPTPAAAPITTPAATPKAEHMGTTALPLDTSIKGKTASWKGIIGVGMNVDQLRSYVESLKFTMWRPSFMVLHNTGAPKLSQWHSVSGAARMANLTNYYKNECRWSAGPHAFVADDLIYPFSPFNGPGTHAPSWNGTSLGIELVGDYNIEDDESGAGAKAYRNAVALFGILHAKLGLNPETIRFHKEDVKTSHKDCPGKHIVKSEFIEDVMEFMGEAGGHPPVVPIAIPTPKPATPVAKQTAVTVEDGLNLRAASSASAKVLSSLKLGTKVEVNTQAMNGKTSWTSVNVLGMTGWVASRFLKVG